MKRLEYILLSFLLMGGSIPQAVLSNTVMVENSSGESFELGIDANDRFLDVLDRIHSYFQQDMLVNEMQTAHEFENHPQWNFVISHAGVTARAKNIPERKYEAGFTKQDKEDIAYIVTTLAWESAADVWKKESKLNDAGNRIEAIHPLNFLYVIFSDEKLTAGISAIKDRKVPTLKSKFFKGITTTLKEEAARKPENLLKHVDDFAERLDIKSKRNEIYPYLKNADYDGFVDKLIELKPREGADRHNM